MRLDLELTVPDATADDWYTPEWVFTGLGLHFDIDVASPPEPPAWIPATNFYTETDDGLTQPWTGLIWCNPPYSDPNPWCRKWATHPNGLILLRADLSSSGPYAAYEAAHALYVPKRRLQFVNGQGGTTGSVNFSTVILARGDAATIGLHRLARTHNGTTRSLREAMYDSE